MTTKVQTKKDEFLSQFAELNAHIRALWKCMILTGRRRIDSARQMLHDFASTAMPDGDKMFFDTLERCAADNARAITPDHRGNGAYSSSGWSQDAAVERISRQSPAIVSVFVAGSVAYHFILPLWKVDARSSVSSFFRSEWSGAA